MIIGHRYRKVYYWRGCPEYNKVSRRNRVVFQDREAAEQAGTNRRAIAHESWRRAPLPCGHSYQGTGIALADRLDHPDANALR